MASSIGRFRKHITIASLLVTAGAVACSSTPQPPKENEAASVTEAVTGTSCQAIDIAARADSTYAVGTDGKVYGWGHNVGGDPNLQSQYVPLGHRLSDMDISLADQVSTPTYLGVSGASRVVAGADGACALKTDGTVMCWGRQLGYAGSIPAFLAAGLYKPAAIQAQTPDGNSAGLTGATGIAYGDKHACAVKSDGTAWCWGDDTLGQLGDGPDGFVGDANTVAVQMVAASPITQVAAAGSTTCVLRTVNGTGEVDCAGDNLSGQLGQGGGGDSNPQPHPTLSRISWPVDQVMDFEALYGGGAGTFCAVTKKVNGAQSTYCWGVNNVGQTGHADTNGNSSPIQISTDVSAYWAQGNQNGCEVNATGTVSCWGMNNDGEIPGASAGDVLNQTPIPGISGAFKVAVGNAHVCVLTTGTLSCWGNDRDGQVGNGVVNQVNVPVTKVRVSAPDPQQLVCGSASLGQACGSVTNACGESKSCGDNCTGVTSCDATTHTCKDDPNKCTSTCASDSYCSNHQCMSYCGTLPITGPSVGVTAAITNNYSVTSPDAYGANGCGAFIVDVTNSGQRPHQELWVQPPTKPTTQDECTHMRLTETQYGNGQRLSSIGPIVGTWTLDGSTYYCKFDTATNQGIWTMTPNASYSHLRIAARLERSVSSSKGTPIWGNSAVTVQLWSSCYNGIVDGDETGADCGGSCPKSCVPDECPSGKILCDCNNECMPAATCLHVCR